MRPAARQRLGFYPLPLSEAKRISRFLSFPDSPCSILDPCIGEGTALTEITRGAKVLRYGIELDAQRAVAAGAVADEVIHGSCFDVQCPMESPSVIYLNPPYDVEISEARAQRMEKVFLEHVYRWLKRTGILVMVIPYPYLRDCSQHLAFQFRDVHIYRLSDPESLKYKQVVIFGVRLTRPERDRLQDSDIRRARLWYESLAATPERMSPLPDLSDRQYRVPHGPPVRMTYKGLPLDQLEDLLPSSSAYRQASTVLFAPPSDVHGRPLTPLHGGHVGLLCTAGLLNGIFGQNEFRHIAHWQSVKLVDTSEEEEEDGATVIREKERFSNELTLVFSTGQVVSLK